MLTNRQVEVVNATNSFEMQHGYPPSLRELCTALGILSTNGIAVHLKALKRKGIIAWDERKSRTIRVLPVGANQC